MTRIKICGIKEEAHATAVTEAGVDFMGLVFANSPRQVTPSQAEKLVANVRSHKKPPQTVGVFVNAKTESINRIAEQCQLDWVQLNGDEPWELCRELNRPIIKVVRVSRVFKPITIINNLALGEKILANQEHIFLIDSNARDKFGGTGQRFNWELARPIADRFPVIIAGGLTPENVREAINIINPWGVDVSSGVETKGAKDTEKINTFINNVKNNKE
jgi:phosphoribosylanthranilate isomerase